MIADYTYSQPVRIRYGFGRMIPLLRETLDEMQLRSAIIVCGKHFEESARRLQALFPEIRAIYAAVQPDPQLSGVSKSAALARETGAQAVIGIGGGSAIDSAKYAAAIAPGSAEAEAYYRGKLPFPERPLSVIAVPTTSGTGSEVTQVSVISCGSEKKTTNHPVFMPKAAIIDPKLTLSVSPFTTMITGLDALAHALEGYWSKNHQPIPDLMAAEAVRLILDNLETVWRDGSNADARCAMSQASLLGGLSFALPKTAGCHALSYVLSETAHLPHGEACAFTLDSFVRINADARLEELCRRVGLSGSEELAARIDGFKRMAGLKRRLSELGPGITPDVLARGAAHPLMQNNPVPMDEAAVRSLFEALR